MRPYPVELFEQGLEMSLEVREQAGLDFKIPLNPYDLCEDLGVKVVFVNDISMEGLYVASGLPKPTIIISTLRPQSRRVFNCGHELGHHVFGHGSTVDQLRDESESVSKDPKEITADSFAGHLLMPKFGVSRSFVTRQWDPTLASPGQIFTIACSFGVGYTTLIHHMTSNLKMISRNRAQVLLKTTLPNIRASILGTRTNQPLFIADEHYLIATVDIEVGNLLLLPRNTVAESRSIQYVRSLAEGDLFEISEPGVYRVFEPKSGWALMIRVSQQFYHGFAKLRHLEVVSDDE